MKAKEMVLCALFSALTAIGAFITIPIPYVPVTLQFFFCAMAGLLLGSKLGAVSQALYVAIGLIGIPVFTQGGGFAYVLKPSFGYLLGFILCAFTIGYITERLKELTLTKLFLAALLGMLTMYAIGVPYLYAIMDLYLKQAKDLGWVLIYGFVLFLPGDILFSLLAAFLGKKLIPVLKKNNLAFKKA